MVSAASLSLSDAIGRGRGRQAELCRSRWFPLCAAAAAAAAAMHSQVRRTKPQLANVGMAERARTDGRTDERRKERHFSYFPRSSPHSPLDGSLR